MKAPIARILIAIALACPAISAAAPEPVLQDADLQVSVPDSLPPAAAWKFQFGAAYRLGGERLSSANSFKLLVTLDLSWSQWQRSRHTWGLGLHAAYSNDAGPRFAPRVHWRTPLGSGPTCLQVAAGVYLLAFDREMNGTPLARLDLPGYLLETEWDTGNVGSFFASAEFLPINLYEDSLGCLSDCTEGATPISSTSITNYSLGMKFAGKEGGITAVVALVMAGLITAAELASWSGL